MRVDGVLTVNNNITGHKITASNWLRNNAAGEGLYNEVSQGHIFQAGNGYWHINSKSDATSGGLIFYKGYQASEGASTNRQGYINWDSSTFGLVDKDGHWFLRTDHATYTQLRANNNTELTVYTSYVRAHGSFRAPIFYDQDDTAYKIDLNGSGYGVNLGTDIHMNNNRLTTWLSFTLTTTCDFMTKEMTAT